MNNDQVRRARAGLTQVIEPADSLAVYAVRAWGPLRVLEVIQGSTPSQDDWIQLKALDPENSAFIRTLRNHLSDAIERWRRRGRYLNPDAALAFTRTLGGQFIIPEDDCWPSALSDLEPTEPLGLWTLGPGTVPSVDGAVSLVGSREVTAYGEAATVMFAQAARAIGLTVLSGGAYGIDACAHRTALETAGEGTATIAVLAGGLDRLYPAANIDLLRRIAAEGLLITEMPPGMRPNRYRFLNRNRLIAALSSVTIILEARYRSGAINTANHAHELGRTVGAVPGPIHGPSSAGCHRLLKETPALLVDSAEDLETFYGHTGQRQSRIDRADHREYDGLDVEEMLVYDALPVQHRTGIDHLTGLTGLAIPRITGILAKLERLALAEKNSQGWRKKSAPGV